MALVDRPALVDRLGARPVALLVAPGGYGKSTLVGQLAAALDVPVVRVALHPRSSLSEVVAELRAAANRAGVPALVETTDPADPDGSAQRILGTSSVLIAFDEVHQATEEAADWIASLARAVLARAKASAARPEQADGRLRLACLGRRLPAPIAELVHEAALVGTDDLRFERDEIARFISASSGVADEEVLDQVVALTAGWPAAVAVVAGSVSRRDVRALSTFSGTVPASALGRVVANLVSISGPDGTRAMRRAASLSLLSPEVVEALDGPGAFEQLLDTGVPLRTRADGWTEIPDAIREAVRAESLDASSALRVAEAYERAGEIVEAARLAWSAGEHEQLCALIARQSRDRLQRAGLSLFGPMLESVADEIMRVEPGAIVQLVRAAERVDRLRDEWLERAQRVVTPATAAARAIAVERALAEARGGELLEARATCTAVISESAADEVLTVGRAHLVRAYSMIVADTAGATDQALADIEQAVGRFRLAGDRAWESDCHLVAGYGCHYTSGRYEAAIDSIERSLALRPTPDTGRSQALTYLAEVLNRLGRLDEAAVALREARAIARRLNDARSITYVAWTLADLHGQRRDPAAAIAALDEAREHSTDLAKSLAGVDFLVDSARIRMLVGDKDGAARDLEHAEETARGTAREELPLVARARFEVMFGNPVVALAALDRLDGSAITYRGERWQRLLLRAAAEGRRGDPRRAAQLVEEAQRLAAAEGDPDRIARSEPELLRLAAPTRAAEETGSATVLLLGRFAVMRGAEDVTPPPGRPQTLVKLLALRGTLAAEEAVDLLWPDADGDTGRARLRNLLNRVRGAAGPLVERRGEALSLASDVVVDAQRFEEAAAVALSAPAHEKAALARRALAWSTGDLLPADTYEDWADIPRERLRRRRLALLDLVADDAVAHGDFAEAARLMDEAIATDPLEELRYVRLASSLLSQGRTRAAASVVDRGLGAARELGVDPGPELRTVRDQIALVQGSKRRSE